MTARSDNDSPTLGLAILAGVMLTLLVIGIALGVIYCEYRSTSDFRRLTTISQSIADAGEQCANTLGEVTRTTIILARNEKPTTPRSGTNLYKSRSAYDSTSH